MNKSILFFLLSFLAQSFISHGQYPLPYYTGWNNFQEKLGWEQFRTGDDHPSDWGYGMSTISHDYPVGGSAADTVRDWFVSPLLSLNEGAILSLRSNVGTPFSDVTPADHFGIWISYGERDPAMGDYQLIADLTNWETGNEWKDTMGLFVPPTGEDGYIAFVYQTNNNWFTVAVDDLHVRKDTVSSVTSPLISSNVKVFPNPVYAGNQVYFESENRMGSNAFVNFFDTQGRLLLSQELDINGMVSIDKLHYQGLVFFEIICEEKLFHRGKILVL